MNTPDNTTSTTIFQIQSGDVEYTAAAVGDIGLSAQSGGATITYTTSTLNAFFNGVGGGGQTGAGVWLDVDAPFDFFDRFIETSGSTITFNSTNTNGVVRSFIVGEGTINISPLLAATEDTPFEHFEINFFEPVTEFDQGVDVTFIAPGDAAITFGLTIQHTAFQDTQFDPDMGAVSISFTSGGPLPALPRQFTAAQKAKFQSDANDLNTIANGLGAMDGVTGGNPAARLANLAASQAASAISPQVGNANSALQGTLALTDALISAPTNPIALPLSIASALANGTSGIMQALANDPPDGNYLEVFAAPDWSFGDLDGVSAAGNALVQDTWALFQEALNLLAAAERFQGADLADDTDAQAMQETAFDAALARFDLQRAAMTEGLTAYLDELRAGGIEDLTFEDDTSLADVQAFLDTLTDPATEDPTLAAWIASMSAALPALLAQPEPEGPSFIDRAVAEALAAVAAATPSADTGSVFNALDEAAATLATPADSPMDGETVLGTDGDDTLTGGAGDDTISGGDGNDQIAGGDGNDLIAASSGDDVVNGGGGDDNMGGGLGDDTMDGGAGNDTLGGGQGADSASGGDGDDIVNGGAGDDILSGDQGNDTMGAGFNSDSVDGGEGADSLGGGTGRDTLDGGAGDDSIGGGEGDDVVNGGDGNDFLAGGGRNDVINGGTGDDRINGGDGDDTMTGGDGADVFIYNFFKAGDMDIITDFEDGVDSFLIRIISTIDGTPNIDNGGNGMQGFVDDLNITQTAAGAQMNVDGHLVLLEGVDAAVLGTEDFMFI